MSSCPKAVLNRKDHSCTKKSFVCGFDHLAYYGKWLAIIKGIPATGDSTEGYL
jgi:hypothetical protein